MAPTLALSGCTIAPSFNLLLQDSNKTFGTNANGVTQIWGGDINLTSLAKKGTIQFMNASNNKVMAMFQGNTGGGLQIFNGGGTAPTGGDKGVGTINVANGYYANGTAGVTCSGTPTSSFASTNGIITHC